MKTVEETRRELFRDWWIARTGYDPALLPSGQYYELGPNLAWLGFNAALDAVVIELPSRRDFTEPKEDSKYWEDAGFNHARVLSRAAIESTNLGIKVK